MNPMKQALAALLAMMMLLSSVVSVAYACPMVDSSDPVIIDDHDAENSTNHCHQEHRDDSSQLSIVDDLEKSELSCCEHHDCTSHSCGSMASVIVTHNANDPFGSFSPTTVYQFSLNDLGLTVHFRPPIFK